MNALQLMQGVQSITMTVTKDKRRSQAINAELSSLKVHRKSKKVYDAHH